MANGFKNSRNYKLAIGLYTVWVSRKNIKNIYLKVDVRNRQIKVSAPEHVSDSNIESFVWSKRYWIEKQLAKKIRTKSTPILNYETGEEHYFKGEQYRLVVTIKNRKPDVYLRGKELILQVKEGTDADKKAKILDGWYRNYLKITIPGIIEKYERSMGVKVSEFGVKKMKTRWGTCNIRAKRIWLNLELAKKSTGCLEMVVVHEMVHLLERLHSKRFYALMDTFMPEWKRYDNELKGLIID